MCMIAQKMKVVRVDNVAVAQERNLHHETAVPIVVSDWISKVGYSKYLQHTGSLPLECRLRHVGPVGSSG
jgi:hypothetical protein